jgi:hypothetical protein
MEPAPTLARRFWQAIEPIHSAVYFAPEPAEAARRIGLRGYWMGYVASRVLDGAQDSDDLGVVAALGMPMGVGG